MTADLVSAIAIVLLALGGIFVYYRTKPDYAPMPSIPIDQYREAMQRHRKIAEEAVLLVAGYTLTHTDSLVLTNPAHLFRATDRLRAASNLPRVRMLTRVMVGKNPAENTACFCFEVERELDTNPESADLIEFCKAAEEAAERQNLDQRYAIYFAALWLHHELSASDR